LPDDRRQGELAEPGASSPSRAQPHDRFVHHDSVDPGRRLGVAPELRAVPENLDEGALQHVTGLVLVAHVAAR
jgi:hypothetical protein